MILSRCSTTSSDSSSARPHLFGTSSPSLLKLKVRHLRARDQDLHSSFRRAGGKAHATRKNLILCAAAAAADMSLKADSEPNNSVSIEEEVRGYYFLVPKSSTRFLFWRNQLPVVRPEVLFVGKRVKLK